MILHKYQKFLMRLNEPAVELSPIGRRHIQKGEDPHGYPLLRPLPSRCYSWQGHAHIYKELELKRSDWKIVLNGSHKFTFSSFFLFFNWLYQMRESEEMQGVFTICYKAENMNVRYCNSILYYFIHITPRDTIYPLGQIVMTFLRHPDAHSFRCETFRP